MRQRKELDQRVDAARRTRDQKIAALEMEAEARRNEAVEKALEAQQKGVEAGRAEQAEEAKRKIEALRKQIDDLRPERRIPMFIQERASAEDYRKHLGVPALIRRDFERLSRMFKTQRAAEAAGRDGLKANAGGEAQDPEAEAVGPGIHGTTEPTSPARGWPRRCREEESVGGR